MSGKQIQIAVMLVAVLALAVWLAWRWAGEKLAPRPAAVARRLAAARGFVSAGAALEAERSAGGAPALDSVAGATEAVRRDVAKFAELLAGPEPGATSAETALQDPAMVRSVSATARAWRRTATKAAERPQDRPAASHLARLAVALDAFIRSG